MKIIDNLKDKFEQAELLTKEAEELKINIANWDLQNISQEKLTRSSLRVIKDNRRGANSTLGSSSKVIDKLIAGAAESAVYGEAAEFNFTAQISNNLPPNVQSDYDQIDQTTIFNFLEKCQSYIKGQKSDLTLDLSFSKKLEKISIKTTAGGNLNEEIVNFQLIFGAPVPGGGSFFYRVLEQPQFFSAVPTDLIDDFLEEYQKTYHISVPTTGKMPVLFSPLTLYFLLVSLQEGVSALNIYRKTSPLIGKINQKIFSDKLTITDLPQMEKSGSRRYFDDEGTLARQQPIIEQGVLKNYIYDLEYAARLEGEPTGNGLKKTLFGGDINTPVSPNFVNAVIKPGDKSKDELLSAVDEGILVDSIVGFHSSNYQQGHFSVQAHGFHLKDGKLQGRLEDVMIAGNIYEDMLRVREIGNTVYPTMKGYAPYILVDDISVTGK